MHTPTLRFHDLPLQEGADKIASLSVRDYADDVSALVDSLDSPPLLVGHSLGGLVAQLAAARTRHAGVVAATPAPAAGIFATYPGTIRLFGLHYLQLRPWTKPLYPATWKVFRRYVTNATDERLAGDLYSELVCDSGRVYCELAFWFLDRAKATEVDFAAITGPVLAIGAERDRTVNRRVGRATARRYANGTYVEIPRVGSPGVPRRCAAGDDGAHRRVDGAAQGACLTVRRCCAASRFRHRAPPRDS